jgi:hypothetical protein
VKNISETSNTKMNASSAFGVGSNFYTFHGGTEEEGKKVARGEKKVSKSSLSEFQLN